MTTPPKVRLFRLKRSDSVVSSQRPEIADPARVDAAAVAAPSPAAQGPGGLRGDIATSPFVPDAGDDGLGSLNMAPAAPPQGAAEQVAAEPGGLAPTGEPAPSVSSDDLMAAVLAVKAEGLTSRQMRTAARLAAQHNISAASNEEAVVLLRRRGIDPFHRGSLSDLIGEEARRSREAAADEAKPVAATAEAKTNAAAGDGGVALARIPVAQVPARQARNAVAQMRAEAPAAPPPPPLTEGQRAKEILKIQRDIARRRRRRAFYLFLRLAVFVLLPTILTGYYYYKVATPLYETKTEFVIQKADVGGGGGSSPLAGMLAGAGIAGNTDSVTVQSYLTSREAMMRLDKDVGFHRFLSDPAVDPLTRVPPDATNEAVYSAYRRMMKISFDPSEGVIKLAVQAVDPKLSEKQALAMISYAEEQVDNLTGRLRADQMKGAQQAYADAEAKVDAAQQRVLDLQQRLGVLDPTAESSLVMNRISALEGEVQKKKLELAQLQSNPTPNAARVAGVKGDIARLTDTIEQERALLTQRSENKESLAQMSGELRIADAELLTRQQMLGTAAAQVETARIEANKQVRYLSIGVPPVPPDVPTYPRAFENTLIAFLIFSGIYLMLSLTAAILREQLSA